MPHLLSDLCTYKPQVVLKHLPSVCHLIRALNKTLYMVRLPQYITRTK